MVTYIQRKLNIVRALKKGDLANARMNIIKMKEEYGERVERDRSAQKLIEKLNSS